MPKLLLSENREVSLRSTFAESSSPYTSIGLVCILQTSFVVAAIPCTLLENG